MMDEWPFVNSAAAVTRGCVPYLEPGAYGLIMADPPWTFATWSDRGKGRSPEQHYRCMTLADICALPVADLAAKDCCLFLWCTWPLLREGLDVLQSWGFAFKTGGAWHKVTKGGKTAFGTGYRVRCASEPWLLGFRGNPKNSRGHRNIIMGEVREHSRKPESAYEWCRTYLPDVMRADVFSRQPRDGWHTWGNEAGKFEVQERGLLDG